MSVIDTTSMTAVAGHAPTTAEEILDLFDALRPGWHHRAACHGLTHIMFPPGVQGSTPGTAEQVRAAVAVCEGCPVRRQCADAGRNETHGTWGGAVRRQPHGQLGGVGQVITALMVDGEWRTIAEIVGTAGVSTRSVRTWLTGHRPDVESRPLETREPGPPPKQHRWKGGAL